MRICNQAGITLIKSFESCRLTAYQDGNGIWTIGWGHTGPEVVQGLVWTQAQADAQFADDLLRRAETPVSAYLTADIDDNQYAAFCSLCFNIGSGNFKASSALHLANAGDLSSVPAHILLWDEVGGHVSAGLLRRRNAEVVLWNTPDEAVS